MTLLTALQAAARELKISVPSTIVANTSSHDAMLLLRMANKEAKQIRGRYPWQTIRKEHSFTTVAADSQTSSIPSDWLKFVSETAFNRTTKRPLYGPITPQEWQEYKAGLIVPVEPAFLVRQGAILIAPTPTAGETVAYEYVSKWVVVASGGTAATKDSFTVDTDTWIFDEEILTLAVIWRWRMHKGMAYEDQQLDYERLVADAFIADGGKPRINTGEVRSGQMLRARGKAQMRDYNTIT